MSNEIDKIFSFAVKTATVIEAGKEIIETVESAVENVNEYEKQISQLKLYNKQLEKQCKQWADKYNKLLDRNLELIKKYEPETLDY